MVRREGAFAVFGHNLMFADKVRKYIRRITLLKCAPFTISHPASYCDTEPILLWKEGYLCGKFRFAI